MTKNIAVIRGDGIGPEIVNQAIAVLEDHHGTKKSNLLSVRIVIGRILLLIGGLVIGASIGHEGPMVQIGGSIMHIFFGYGPLKRAEHRQMLVLAGGAPVECVGGVGADGLPAGAAQWLG